MKRFTSLENLNKIEYKLKLEILGLGRLFRLDEIRDKKVYCPFAFTLHPKVMREVFLENIDRNFSRMLHPV